MTKAELVEKVSGQINLTKKQTEVVVNTVFQSITDSLSNGKKVELRGFGSFRIRERNARVGFLGWILKSTVNQSLINRSSVPSLQYTWHFNSLH